jgi:hypothetical protein
MLCHITLPLSRRPAARRLHARVGAAYAARHPPRAAHSPKIRDLESGFTNALAAAAPSFLERYAASSDSPELDALPEEVQVGLRVGWGWMG